MATQHTRLLSEAALFFELNDTDGDLGIHASIDGEPWTSLEIDGPGDRELLSIISRSNLRTQGLTQLSFESSEPPFDELAPQDFFRRFPEGRYEIEAHLDAGGSARATALLSHVLAAPPENIRLSGVPAADRCDEGALPIVAPPVTIAWEDVTASHPDIGSQSRGPIKVRRYQLFVEGNGTKLSLDLPPTVTAFEVPTAVTNPSGTFKFEIIVQTATGNNTAIESCFIVP
jgi:hypothetical protein